MKKVKMKTRKSVSRRVKITGSGKLLRRRGFGRHLKANKTKSQKKKSKRSVEIVGSYNKKLRRSLGI